MRRTADRWLCKDGQLGCRILLIQELLRCLILHYRNHIIQRQQDPGHKEAKMGKNQSTLSNKRVSGSTCLRQQCYSFACIKINSLVRISGFSSWWNPGEPMWCLVLESPGPKLVPAMPSLLPGAEIFVMATSLPSLLFLPWLFQTEIQAAVWANPQNPPTCPTPEYPKCCIRSTVGLFLNKQDLAFLGSLPQ